MSAVNKIEHSAKFDPMHQFEVYDIFSIMPRDAESLSIIGFTNSALFMVLSLICAVAFLSGGMRKQALVPGRWQSMVELTYEFISGMIKDSVGLAGRKYFPFIFALFMFIIGCNLLGLLPGSFTVTSHVIVTFAIAISIFIAITIIGFVRHGFKFLRIFLPDGVPMFLWPLMICIEMISYLARPVTLSLRLAGNMMAGHVLLKVIASFVVSMGVFGVLPIALLVVFTGFEFLVAMLQAYIFSLLVCIYLNDAIHLH